MAPRTGHFAVIEGYQSTSRRLVAVEDPWTGSVDVPYDSLQSGRYRGNGKWTHSYFTAEAGRAMTIRPVETSQESVDAVREHLEAVAGRPEFPERALTESSTRSVSLSAAHDVYSAGVDSSRRAAGSRAPRRWPARFS